MHGACCQHGAVKLVSLLCQVKVHVVRWPAHVFKPQIAFDTVRIAIRSQLYRVHHSTHMLHESFLCRIPVNLIRKSPSVENIKWRPGEKPPGQPFCNPNRLTVWHQEFLSSEQNRWSIAKCMKILIRTSNKIQCRILNSAKCKPNTSRRFQSTIEMAGNFNPLLPHLRYSIAWYLFHSRYTALLFVADIVTHIPADYGLFKIPTAYVWTRNWQWLSRCFSMVMMKLRKSPRAAFSNGRNINTLYLLHQRSFLVRMEAQWRLCSNMCQ